MIAGTILALVGLVAGNRRGPKRLRYRVFRARENFQAGTRGRPSGNVSISCFPLLWVTGPGSGSGRRGAVHSRTSTTKLSHNSFFHNYFQARID
jgi:hypothetical protein